MLPAGQPRGGQAEKGRGAAWGWCLWPGLSSQLQPPVWAPLQGSGSQRTKQLLQVPPPFSEQGGQGEQTTSLHPPSASWSSRPRRPAGPAVPTHARKARDMLRCRMLWEAGTGICPQVLRSWYGVNPDKWACHAIAGNPALDIQTWPWGFPKIQHTLGLGDLGLNPSAATSHLAGTWPFWTSFPCLCMGQAGPFVPSRYRCRD